MANLSIDFHERSHLLERLDILEQPMIAARLGRMVMTPEAALSTLCQLEGLGCVERDGDQDQSPDTWAYCTRWVITQAGREALHAHFAPYRVAGM